MASAVGYLLSFLVGGLMGLLEAETIAFSLLEISLNVVFAIVFGVGFCILGLVLAWRIWATLEGVQRIVMWIFSALVLASGISCFFLKQGWIQNFSAGGKVPLYALLGMSFSFTITFCFTECLSLPIWDRFCACCSSDGTRKPIFGTSKQIFALFGTSLFMGSLFGLLFGLVDVENDTQHDRLKLCTIYSIPLGVGIGALFGVLNEYYRQREDVSEEQQAIINRTPDHDSVL